MTVQEALDHPWLCQECNYSTKTLESSNYLNLLHRNDDNDDDEVVQVISKLLAKHKR